MKIFPGIEGRLPDVSRKFWTKIFLGGGGKKNAPRIYPKLTRPDLEVLAIPAVQGAGTDKEKAAVCTSIGDLGLRGAIPELRNLVRNSPKVPEGRYEACKEAVNALGKLGAKEAAPEILAFLKSPAGFTLDGEQIKALGELGARGAGPDIAKYLTAPGQYEREWAARALSQLRAREMIPQILPLLRDAEWNVRAQAANTLSELGAHEALPRLLELLKDSECQGRVAGAIGKIATPKEITSLHSLLKS